MENKNKRVLLHLSLIPGVGPSTIINKIIKGLFLQLFPDLLQACLMELIDVQEQIDFEILYKFTINDFIKKCHLTERLAQAVVDGLIDKNLLIKELDLIEKHDVVVVSIFESSYPEILKQITTPPTVLYCKGAALPVSAKRFSIVGSRKADVYASQVITSLVPSLIANGWHIVSGGAEGVDTMAHRATLNVGGQTLVVMGSGLLHPYPYSNKEFFKEIEQNGGTIISSFSLNTSPDKSTFPARNRIIAGLSQGCLVVRAAERSGALITAQFALDQGRLVFAVPGSIYDDLSAGCHGLIQQGAKLVNTVSDIFDEFKEVIALSSFTPALVAQQERQSLINDVLSLTSDSDEFILHFLSSSRTVDELSLQTGLPLNELLDRLFTMQLNGKVRQDFAGQWARA